MKKAIFVTINSFVGLPPVKQLVSYLKVDYELVAIQCTIGNFENFLLDNQIIHKTVLDFTTAISFNSQVMQAKLENAIFNSDFSMDANRKMNVKYLMNIYEN